MAYPIQKNVTFDNLDNVSMITNKKIESLGQVWPAFKNFTRKQILILNLWYLLKNVSRDTF